MRRLHLLEIHDQPWCPRSLRDALTDFLQFAERVGRAYTGVGPLLRAAVERCGARRIVDLCSGAGGPWPDLHREVPVPVLLTDKYPNRTAAAGPIAFHPVPVDAKAVPSDLEGFRTLFTSFHHFRPAEARAILADAVRRRQGIAVFEVVQRAPLDFVLIALTWLAVVALMPFVRPFRWSRLFWTYLPPLLPLVGTFDGLVSCLRIYSRPELGALLHGLDTFDWEIGRLPGAWGAWSPLRGDYLIGVPKQGLAV